MVAERTCALPQVKMRPGEKCLQVARESPISTRRWRTGGDGQNQVGVSRTFSFATFHEDELHSRLPSFWPRHACRPADLLNILDVVENDQSPLMEAQHINPSRRGAGPNIYSIWRKT